MSRFKLISKVLLVFVVWLSFSSTAFAAVGVPNTVNYQGRLKSAAGAALSGTYDFIFTLYDASTGGTLLATETHNDVTVTNGHFSVVLDFDGDVADFANLVYVDIQVKEDSETSYETMTTRATLHASLYAFFTKAIENSAAAPADNLFAGRVYFNTSDGNMYNYDGSSWSAIGGGTLDAGYDAFAANAAKIVVDASEGQTGGFEIESTVADNVVIDLRSTGDFVIQDLGTPFATFSDTGIFSTTGNVTVGGDLTISGDDLFMGTNTSGMLLVADGTNFNPVAVSSDATLASNGALTIAANAVALATDTTGNFIATVADAGSSTITVANSGTENAAVTLDVIDVNCTDCLNATEIEDIYLLTAGDELAGTLDLNGNKIDLDADADTSITADSDDQIDIEISGADDFRFTANTFNVLTGSSLTFVDSGEAISGDGTNMTISSGGDLLVNLTGANFAPSVDDGAALGIAGTNDWSDLFFATGAVINWENSDVTLTHSANTLTMAGGDLIVGGKMSSKGNVDVVIDADGASPIDIGADDFSVGSLVDLDYDTPEIQTGSVTGIDLNLDTNLTGADGASLIGVNLTMAGLSDSADSNNTESFIGFNLKSAGAMTLNDAGSTMNWRGVNVSLPTITQTAGTVTADGVRVTFPANAPVVTGGTMNGINVVAPTGSGPAGAATINGINIGDYSFAGGAATEIALNIGSGWDVGINGATGFTLGVGGAKEVALSAITLGPTSDDGSALGSAGKEWSDLFLNTGGVINWEAGDVTLTHSANTLSMAGGDLIVGGKMSSKGNVDVVIDADGAAPIDIGADIFSSGNIIDIAYDSAETLDGDVHGLADECHHFKWKWGLWYGHINADHDSDLG